MPLPFSTVSVVFCGSGAAGAAGFLVPGLAGFGLAARPPAMAAASAAPMSGLANSCTAAWIDEVVARTSA